MRLKRMQRGRSIADRWRRLSYLISEGQRMPDIDRALLHRPDLIGGPLLAYTGDGLRGESEWTIGERELFGSFVAHRSQCPFCATFHREFALQAFPPEVVDAAFEDWRTAPLDDRLRTTLGFLEKLTLAPTEVGPVDVRRVLDAGVSVQALEDAVHVAVGFNVIVRIANALDFELPPAKDVLHRARVYARRVQRMERGEMEQARPSRRPRARWTEPAPEPARPDAVGS